VTDEHRPTEVQPQAQAPVRRESRFTPGVVLADRFRIIALIGKGGMGEVYRAEDLKLGQQVALKFLPRTLAADKHRLERLYSEVRLGRQVSHPNVCRVYDVMEWEGHHFISMEYIDGEDLASLLRRIGKLPHEKGIDIARDLCNGLAAAHGVGVIHRDLKPANIMIDGRGMARITDFGLAALAEDISESGEISGTPAYMAPEQRVGGEVTVKTDLYAVGLILYELFTGKRRSEESSQSASQSTKELEPAVQRVILRCIEEKPESRPPSVHAVIAALPGGDPLQAALDAGETPSPEMVAAAGESGALRPAIAGALLAVVLVLIAMNTLLSQKVMLYARASLPKKPEVLADRARAILAMAGYTREPADTAYNLGWNNDYFESDRARRENFDQVRPSPVVFYYRESPRELVAVQDERRVTPYDPPFVVSGMANVEIDAHGRLIRFAVVPPEVADPPKLIPAVDWMRFITEAGIDPTTLRAVTPQWRVPVDSDSKLAWEARFREQPDFPVRVEVASRHGRPVSFAVVPPWQKADRREFAGAPQNSRMAQIVAALIGFFAVWAALFLAQRNVRRSRGDRKGSIRLAIFVMFLVFLTRGFRADHAWDIPSENDVLREVMSEAIVAGVIMWVIYIAIEPYFRRRWPRLLIGWTRLLAGRPRDPMVGRDLLVGAAAGCASAVLSKVAIAAPSWFGAPPPVPVRTYFTALTELRHVGFLVLNCLMMAVGISMLLAFLFLFFHIVTRRAAAATILLGFMGFVVSAAAGMTQMIAAVAVAIGIVVVFRHWGLLALVSMQAFENVMANAPVTFDTSVWYFGRSFFLMALLAGAAAWAFWVSLAAQPVLQLALLEEE
jgi:hypothetical protein